ncbi:MAG TPA: hypothetical protein P5069_18710 [Candidatus Hydrogenedentes bacterium]|nr:hypothetical protein [Candidatus Hydrogenedentota bacterium]
MDDNNKSEGVAESGKDENAPEPCRNHSTPAGDFSMGILFGLVLLVPGGFLTLVSALGLLVALTLPAGEASVTHYIMLVLFAMPGIFLLFYWLYQVVKAFRTRRPYLGLGMISFLLGSLLFFGACSMLMPRIERPAPVEQRLRDAQFGQSENSQNGPVSR